MRYPDGQPIGADGVILSIVASAVLLFLIVPVLIVIALSFSPTEYMTFPPHSFSLRWYKRILYDPQWLDAVGVSLRVGVIASLVSTLLAIPASYTLVRRNFRLKEAVYAFILAPLIVPVIITSIGMYFFFVQVGGSGSVLAMGLGHAVLTLPVVVLIITATLQGFDARLEQAAFSLGASRQYTFRRITLPLVAPGIFAASVFAFLISFDELLVPLFLSGIRMQTLSVKMWDSIQYELSPVIAAVSSLVITVTLAGFILSALLRQAGRRNAKRAA